MGVKVQKAESILRLLAMVLAVLSALVLGLDSQTKTIFFMEKKATVKLLPALWVLTIIESVAAACQLIQICCTLAWVSKDSCGCTKFVAWMLFLLDQGVTYVMFAALVAATQAAMVAVTGVKHLQWSKLCNIYTRFCIEGGGGILIGLFALFAMAIISSISAHRLFRLYPSYPSPPPRS